MANTRLHKYTSLPPENAFIKSGTDANIAINIPIKCVIALPGSFSFFIELLILISSYLCHVVFITTSTIIEYYHIDSVYAIRFFIFTIFSHKRFKNQYNHMDLQPLHLSLAQNEDVVLYCFPCFPTRLSPRPVTHFVLMKHLFHSNVHILI